LYGLVALFFFFWGRNEKSLGRDWGVGPRLVVGAYMPARDQGNMLPNGR
jgi:hypothetical protein